MTVLLSCWQCGQRLTGMIIPYGTVGNLESDRTVPGVSRAAPAGRRLGPVKGMYRRRIVIIYTVPYGTAGLRL
eukprot:438246-Hanusia_phi.AAC.2